MSAPYFFPYPEIRPGQKRLVADILSAVHTKRHVIACAPTGIGKTMAALGPTVKYAIENKKTVIFLTPKHTQHDEATKALKQIRETYGVTIPCADFIGKQWMCAVDGVDNLQSGQFADFCSKQVEDRKCQFYVQTRKSDGKATVEAEDFAGQLEKEGPQRSSDLVRRGKQAGFCPYEITSLLATRAKVVIADYFHILHPGIRERFLKRIGKELEDCIVIIDEGHNVPERVRSLLSSSLSTYMLTAARREVLEAGFNDEATALGILEELLLQLAQPLPVKAYGGIRRGEELLSQNAFTTLVEGRLSLTLNELSADLSVVAEEIQDKSDKDASVVASVASFLAAWGGDDVGYVRLIEKQVRGNSTRVSISYRCLDPSLITGDIISQAHTVVLMSGTLRPTKMYADLLGFPADTIVREYPSSFKDENRQVLVVPQTTTRYDERSDEQFQEIAKICSQIANNVPGNSAFFFPSYYLRDTVYKYFGPLCTKTVFLEEAAMTKSEKGEFLEKFRSYRKTGAALLGVVSGSFAEGIDLPGDDLKAVTVVGVPLSVPDLEQKKLIEYYDHKFGKGREYAYTFPAMAKCLQGAGRCLRTDSDRGVMVFLDKRFAWPTYLQLMPQEWKIDVTSDYENKIKKFFLS